MSVAELVDRQKFVKHYTRRYVAQEYFYRNTMGGSFATGKVLTPQGTYVYGMIKRFANKSPDYNGFSLTGIYFKWNLHEQSPVQRADILVLADWIRDQGYTVDVEEGEAEIRIVDRDTPRREFTYSDGRVSYWRYKKAVKVSTIKLKILHPGGKWKSLKSKSSAR